MEHPLHDLITQLREAEICVCGDFMLDKYVRGRVDRVSPEGPIPVLHVDEKHHSPGGAGSVAAMLSALQSRVRCAGIRGTDIAGNELEEQLAGYGCDTRGLIADKTRPTTLKTRYMGYVHSAGRGMQQMIRVDEESTSPISEATADEISKYIDTILPQIDLLLIQDMAKGVFSPKLLQQLIAAARSYGKPVVVDPSIKQHYSAYRNATCILPNRMETEHAFGLPLNDEKDYSAAASGLIEKLELDFVLLTLDREGSYFATRDGIKSHVPTTPRSVLDVTGAGDMVAAMLALALAGGLAVKDAARLANIAAGIEVERQGASPVSRSELEAEISATVEPFLVKIKTENGIEQTVNQIRSRGETIAFTNGAFDLLHLGHVELIRFASNQADCLIVGMNSDSSVRAYKGPGRPITPQEIRARTLAVMPNVDYVVIFDDPSVQGLIDKVQPDVLIKGGDYSSKEEVVGWETVERRGGRVLRAPHVKGYSTTDIIRKIKGS